MDNNSSITTFSSRIHYLLDTDYARRHVLKTNNRCSGFIVNENMYLKGFWYVLGDKIKLSDPININSVEVALTTDSGAEKLMSRMLNKLSKFDSIEIRTIEKEQLCQMVCNDSKAYHLCILAEEQTLSYLNLVGHKYEHDKQFNYQPMFIQDCPSEISSHNELVVELNSDFVHIVGQSLKDPKTVVVYICDLNS